MTLLGSGPKLTLQLHKISKLLASISYLMPKVEIVWDSNLLCLFMDICLTDDCPRV